MGLAEVFFKTNRVYFSTLNLVLGFSVFIFLSLALLPFLSSYVSVGGGFIRFSSLYLDLTIPQAILIVGVALLSLLFLSFFVSALINIVKVRETLDHVRFTKVTAIFKKYVLRVFFFLLFLSIASILIGTIFEFMSMPRLITQLVIFAIWLPLIFAPQVIILEDFRLGGAFKDSIKFVVNSPMSLIVYVILGAVLLLLFTLVETSLGHYFIWEHRIVSIFFVSIFVVPYLQMFATELYILRYPISHV